MDDRVSEHRTQLYLPEELHRQLKAYAQRRKISMSEAMRRAITQLIAPKPTDDDPIHGLVGAVRLGVSTASDDDEIDAMLYGQSRRKTPGTRRA